jgi:hypothetical protein
MKLINVTFEDMTSFSRSEVCAILTFREDVPVFYEEVHGHG